MTFTALKETLKLGANPDCCDSSSIIFRRTPVILIACYSLYSEIVEMLLCAGADINKRDLRGSSVLMELAGHPHANIETVQLLLNRGADVNAVDIFGNTPLIYGAMCGNLEIMRELIKAGADTNIRNNHKNSALHLTVQSQSMRPPVMTKIITMLLDAGADINSDPRDGTPFMHAAFSGCISGMTVLYEAGADINKMDRRGKTGIEILKETHPDKYKEWMRYMKKRLLEFEDTTGLYNEPNFDI